MFRNIEREEALYELVAEELSSGQLKQGLWLKALVQADSNDNKARAEYTKLRVAQLDREYKEAVAQLDREYKEASEKAQQMANLEKPFRNQKKKDDSRPISERERDLKKLKPILKQKRCVANANPNKGFALHLSSGTSKFFGRLKDLEEYLQKY